MVCPTFATCPVVEGVLPDEVVATAVSTVEMVVLVVFFAVFITRADTPIQPRTITPTTPSTIQSQVLLFFFGG